MDQAVEAVETRAAAKAPDEAVQFDFSGLILMIFEFLSTWLKGCLANQSPESVANTMKTSKFWRTRAINHSINQLKDENGKYLKLRGKARKALFDSMVEEIDDTPTETCIALLNEVEENQIPNDWDAFA